MMHEQPSHHGSSFALAGSEEPRLDWHRAHEGLSRLARSRARLDWEEGRLLLAALRSTAHSHLGFGSFGEYIERILGHTRRATEERLRVAEALERLPGLANALRDGSLSWSAVRELTRVATASNEEAWIDIAKGRTLRQIEERLFVDLHHVALRSEGGEHSVDNLITVCRAHHRALHRGQLVIDGHSASHLVFRHADGTPYGARIVDPSRRDSLRTGLPRASLARLSRTRGARGTRGASVGSAR